MWNLIRPDVTSARDHLDTLFPDGVPGSALSSNDKDSVMNLYAAYELGLGRPDLAWEAAGLTVDILKTLLEAYGTVSDNGKLCALRSALMLAVTECPYCGFGEIRDLDHHLQKAHFNCFSIFALNLVPACSKCNGHKPRKPQWDPKKHLLHAYLEDVSNLKFLKAEVTINDKAMSVKFVIEKCPGMSDELHARLVQHIKNFRLNKRYPAQINTFLSEQKTGLEFAFEVGGADGVRLFLERSSGALQKTFGVNDWRTALLLALATSVPFYSGGFRDILG